MWKKSITPFTMSGIMLKDTFLNIPDISTSVFTFSIFILYICIHTYMEKALATHSSTLARKFPWMEEPSGLQSMGSRRLGGDWATSLSLFSFMLWRRKWQPTPVFLPGESQRWGEPGGLPSMGSHRVRHDCRDLAAAYIHICVCVCVCVCDYRFTPV